MKNSTAFILLLVSVGLLYTFIMPEYGKVQALSAEASQYENILKNISSLSSARDALLVQYNALPADQVDELSKALPDKPDTVSLAAELDSIASRYGLTVKGVSAEKAAQSNNAVVSSTPMPGGYSSTDVDVTLIGPYPAFKSFLTDLEQSLRILDVRSVSFTTTENGALEYDLVVRTYWIPS